MNKLINGKRYNNETALPIIILSPLMIRFDLHEFSSESTIQLMRKTSGEYFIYMKTIDVFDPKPYETILPQPDLNTAINLISNYIDDTDENAYWAFNDGWFIDLIESSYLDFTSSSIEILNYVKETEKLTSGEKRSVSLMIPKTLLDYIDSKTDDDTTRTDVIIGMLARIKNQENNQLTIEDYL